MAGRTGYFSLGPFRRTDQQLFPMASALYCDPYCVQLLEYHIANANAMRQEYGRPRRPSDGHASDVIARQASSPMELGRALLPLVHRDPRRSRAALRLLPARGLQVRVSCRITASSELREPVTAPRVGMPRCWRWNPACLSGLSSKRMTPAPACHLVRSSKFGACSQALQWSSAEPFVPWTFISEAEGESGEFAHDGYGPSVVHPTARSPNRLEEGPVDHATSAHGHRAGSPSWFRWSAACRRTATAGDRGTAASRRCPAATRATRSSHGEATLRPSAQTRRPI